MCSFEQFGPTGKEGAATNEVGECKLSEQKEGKCEPPKGRACKEKKGVTCGEAHTYLYILIFVFSFFNMVLIEGNSGQQICIIG